MSVAIVSPPAISQNRPQVANTPSTRPAVRTRPTIGPSLQQARASQPAIPVEPSLLATAVSPALDDLTETVIVAFKTAVRTLTALASDITGNAREARLAACALLRLRIPDLHSLRPPTDKPAAPRRPAPAPSARSHPAPTAAPSAPQVLSQSPPAPPKASAPQPLSPTHIQSAVSAPPAPSAPPIDPLPASSTPKRTTAHVVEDIQARIADLESAINTAAEAFHSSTDLVPDFPPDPLYARCGPDLPASPAAALMAVAGAPYSLRSTER